MYKYIKQTNKPIRINTNKTFYNIKKKTMMIKIIITVNILYWLQ